MDCNSISMWGLGKLCGISSLVTSVRFHGPVWCQMSRIGVASWGRPYLVSIVRATSWGLLFQPAIICSTLTLYSSVDSVGRVGWPIAEPPKAMKVTPPTIKRSRRVLPWLPCFASDIFFLLCFGNASHASKAPPPPLLLRVFLLRFQEKIVDLHICSDKRNKAPT